LHSRLINPAELSEQGDGKHREPEGGSQ